MATHKQYPTKWIALSFALLLVPLVLLLIFGPASWRLALSSTFWRLQGAVLLDTSQGQMLFVAASSYPPNHKGNRFARYTVFSVEDGAILYDRVVPSHFLNVLGISGGSAWVNDFDGGFYELLLPSLQRGKTLEGLLEKHPKAEILFDPIQANDHVDFNQSNLSFRLQGRDGYQYELDTVRETLTPLPLESRLMPHYLRLDDLCDAPKMLQGRPVLGGSLVCTPDINGDRYLAHQELTGERGKMLLSRITAKGELVWSRTEEEMLKERESEIGRRLQWGAFVGEDLLLILTEPQTKEDSLYVLRVSRESGEVQWMSVLE